MNSRLTNPLAWADWKVAYYAMVATLMSFGFVLAVAFTGITASRFAGGEFVSGVAFIMFQLYIAMYLPALQVIASRITKP